MISRMEILVGFDGAVSTSLSFVVSTIIKAAPGIHAVCVFPGTGCGSGKVVWQENNSYWGP